MEWEMVRICLVDEQAGRHSIHSYFNACPESPDGRYVLYFTSTASSGECGGLRILDRMGKRERVIVDDVVAEDAHRVACQQWYAGGRKVVYHDFKCGRWLVMVADVATGEVKVLAEDRQLGFGAPMGQWAPLYGSHWKQGAHRDLEMVHVDTGEIRTVVRVRDVLERYGDEVREIVGDGDVSIFFPVVSPDGDKVFFKMARGSGTDDFKSPQASRREGKFVYDLKRGEFLRFFREWGHPSWSPDSSGIFEKGNILLDLASGKERCVAPGAPSDHPSLSPAQGIFVTDADITYREGGKPKEWGICVGSLETDEFTTIHRFDHSQGAKSWRIAHPHPVFSADGRRIYFNVSDGPWTRLHVAEVAPVEAESERAESERGQAGMALRA